MRTSYDPAGKFELKVSEVEFHRTPAGRQLMARIYQPQGVGPFPTDEETMQVCRRVVHALASETSVLDVTQPAPPTPLPNDLEPPKPLSALTRDDVLKMHTHYNGLIAKELEFCFKYLNFYIGLLSALVAATLTGLLPFTLPHPRGLLLLLGPLLVIVLAVVGYKTVRVFYRRYMEAWITSLKVIAAKLIRYPFDLVSHTA